MSTCGLSSAICASPVLMKSFIFTARNGIHVIDLQQTIKLIKDCYMVETLVKFPGHYSSISTL